jgi:hypothetical protein
MLTEEDRSPMVGVGGCPRSERMPVSVAGLLALRGPLTIGHHKPTHMATTGAFYRPGGGRITVN